MEHGDGGAVLAEGLGVATEALQEQGALHAQEGGVCSAQVGSRSFHLGQGVPGPALEEEGVAQLRPGERFQVGDSGVVGSGDGPLEVVFGGREVVRLARDQAQGALRRRAGDAVVGVDGLGQAGLGEGARFTG